MKHDSSQNSIRKIHHILADILTDYYQGASSEKVLDYHERDQLVGEFYRESPPAEGIGLAETLAEFRNGILAKSVKTWHPLFMNQMFPGASYPAVLGDCLTSLMNTTLATWEVAPVATIIERNVSEWMAGVLGLPEGGSGIFLPGSSLANLVALTVARNQRLGDRLRQTGLYGRAPAAIVCSQNSHYSIANAANILGIGENHLMRVRTNDCNEMLVDDLVRKVREATAQGIRPFAVVATAGSTVTGCMDPISDIADVCERFDMHLHVDAAFGGAMTFVPEGKKRLHGIERADSVCWDAHKSLHAPLTSTALLFPNADVLKDCFDSGANYLFHPHAGIPPETEDLGRYTPLCGKRFDALKLWILWNAYGTDYFRDFMADRVRLSERFYEMLAKDPDFQPSHKPCTPLQCFRFLPPALSAGNPDEIDRFHRAVREEIIHRGMAFFNIARLNGRDHFRTVLINPLTALDDLRRLLEDIRSIGQKYLQSGNSGHASVVPEN